MPFPGSQEMDSLGLAYSLFSWRWSIRLICGFLTILGFKEAWERSKIITLIPLAILAVIFFMANFKMRADRIFHQSKQTVMVEADHNKVARDRLVIGITHNNEAKAYPINFIGYHHQVQDSIGGKPVMITYCTVCRTGRVYEPVVNGKTESFRLVGMDHYNAMFEDKTTCSWWRQATGEAVAGSLKGHRLPEYPFIQTSLELWLTMFPNSLILQPDSTYQDEYDSLANFEIGKTKGRLERRDTISWKDKSWIAGIELGDESKAYDWNNLIAQQIIHDEVGYLPILLFVSADRNSLFAYRRFYPEQIFSIQNDTLSDGTLSFDLAGRALNKTAQNLQPIKVTQEYWHSWRTFHPSTLKQEN